MKSDQDPASGQFFPGLPILRQAQVGLASGSLRRRELLARLLPPTAFEVVAADLDESRLPGEGPFDYVRRLALAKAAEGARRWQSRQPTTQPRLIVAADTSVVIGDLIYGKPTDLADAARMLAELSGRPHQVLTGFAVRLLDAAGTLLNEDSAVNVTEVYIRPLSEAEINLVRRHRRTARQSRSLCGAGFWRHPRRHYPRRLLQRGRSAARAVDRDVGSVQPLKFLTSQVIALL